jgi:hypothetical protein
MQILYESPRKEAREAHGWLTIERKKRVYCGGVFIPCLEKGGKGKGAKRSEAFILKRRK